MKWNLAEENRKAAELQLRKQGKTLREYPWPEDHWIDVDVKAHKLLSRVYYKDGQIVIEVK